MLSRVCCFQTTHDLEVVDKRRREEFKTYEMEKEYEYQEKLKNLPEEEKKKELQHHEELQKKHKQHEKINHPVSVLLACVHAWLHVYL